jgi:hypothetical protein
LLTKRSIPASKLASRSLAIALAVSATIGIRVAARRARDRASTAVRAPPRAFVTGGTAATAARR